MARPSPSKSSLGRGQRAAALAVHELAQVREQTAQARSALVLMQHDVMMARAELASSKAPLLVEVNEQLVMAVLRTQVEAENTERRLVAERVTDQLRHESQRLEAENRQLTDATRLKSEFLSMMSHELRTPLNAIIGFSDLLVLGRVATMPAKCQEFGRHIAASGRHLLQLINDVLDLSKIEAGKFEFRPMQVNLPVLVDGIVAILEPMASNSGLRMHAEVDPGLTDLVLDPMRLKQVLYNFISNAIKFTPSGGQVTVRALPEGLDCFRIEVEDTGIGVAAEDQPGLFVMFHQLDSSIGRKYEGTGLGLALTRKLVEMQGGSVGMRSTLGVGSVFYMVLKRHVGAVNAP